MELKKPGEKYLKKAAAPKAESLEPTSPPKPKKSAKKQSFSLKSIPKQVYIIVAAVLGAALVALAVIFFLSLMQSTNQSQLESDLETLGRDFYETYYFEQLSAAYASDEDPNKLEHFLALYADNGIKVNLDNLRQYPTDKLDNAALVADFKNSETDEPCDSINTKVTIYPQSPYSKTNYRLETTLICGFEDNKD